MRREVVEGWVGGEPHSFSSALPPGQLTRTGVSDMSLVPWRAIALLHSTRDVLFIATLVDYFVVVFIEPLSNIHIE